MIVEVRTYTLKPGQRDRFIEFFKTTTAPAQRSFGMKVLGPFVDLENPDVFVFLRSFPTLAAREEMKNALYESDLWKKELEGIAMPMIESYSVVLTEAEESVSCFE
jgi:hypothetical protein